MLCSRKQQATQSHRNSNNKETSDDKKRNNTTTVITTMTKEHEKIRDIKKTRLSTQEKRVNILLDEKTHTKAKILSVLTGVTLNEYLARAVEERTKKDEIHFKKIGGLQK